MSHPTTARPHVFIRRRIPEAGLRRLDTEADVEVWEDALPPSCTHLLQRVAGVHGLRALLADRVNDELLDAAGPGLRVVSDPVLPHVWSVTQRTRARMAEKPARNLLAGLDGESLPDPVNPEVRTVR